ncbi:MAG: thermonuclease family protein [Candidatus Thiodiazotropha sp. (ex Dulcina madagascariensis)]|nr:thermonuclease family protein [Candidatus Thiodiazotropha sp. (ex Dulcina madagascariensis)]
MRRLIMLLLIMPASPLAWCAQYGQVDVARVVSIYDADTFRVDIAGWPPIIGHNVPIRVIGIDAPEMRGRCEQERTLARLARAMTVALLNRATNIELRAVRRGKYFRLLAEVWVDGVSLGRQLIDAGLARPYAGGKRGGWCP